MSNNFNVDEAVRCIKDIVDTNRCGTCDQAVGERVRYPCGHSSCDDCAATATHCLLCLTPPNSGNKSSALDDPATTRAKNASELLKTFQAAFKLDVYKRQRISDHLKIEKELFPECIQAPIKYFNKRKSSVSLKNKENKRPSFFPGQEISLVKEFKMENSFNYVKKWLDNNENKPKQKTVTKTIERRKPFADLNINKQSSPQKRILKRADKILDKDRENAVSPAKRKYQSHFKSAQSIVESQSILDQYFKEDKFKQKKEYFNEHDKIEIRKKLDKDESGIEIDDEPIVIDDSQNEVVDKDKLAWLAVLEANEKSPYNQTQSTKVSCSAQIESDAKKVPFFKKSYLTETCSLCKGNKHRKNNVANETANKNPKDISIAIENRCFTTTIKVSTEEKEPIWGKTTKCIQTDISSVNDLNYEHKTQVGNVVLKQDDEFNKGKELEYSQDVFTGEAKNSEENKAVLLKKESLEELREPSEVVIADSDSDNGLNESSIIQVTADIHQSSENLEEGILTELYESEVQRRPIRSGRGHTPTSTDSSDKENYDPNRAKRPRMDKNSKKRKTYEISELNFIGTMDD
uniref:RING-type domain-containing protein n=1 Tax=Pectinophora gossypiella TaxID=13191 RepID=A0A1E1WNB3_PECGO